MAQPPLTRRDFLATSTRTAAALGAGSLLTPATAVGERRKIGANDRIAIGIIGSGGMGTYDVRAACNVENVVCAALCDVAEFRLNHASAVATEAMESKGHSAVRIDRYGDYRELLDRKDIDAVIIATPDHWHRRPFIDACEAGKHIYQEKPFSFSIQDGDDMLAAAQKRPELTIQIGTQRRSGSHYQKAKAIIDEGKLGKILHARAYDCRNFVSNPDPFAPQEVGGPIDWEKFQEPCANKVAYDPWRYFAWRWYWDYANGLLTDVGVHVIDVVHWLTGCDTPKSAVCNGGVYGLKYWETPDVVDAVWDYGAHSVVFTSNFTNGFQGNGLTLYGTEATLEIRGARIFVWAEGQRDQPIHEWAPEGIEHQRNWIDCIRNGQKPNAPVELGVSSLLPLHLATLAYRKGTRVEWDAKESRIKS